MITFQNPVRSVIRPREQNPSALAIAVTAAALGAVGVGGYVLWKKYHPAKAPPTPSTPAEPTEPTGPGTGDESQEPVGPHDTVTLLVESPYMNGNVTHRASGDKPFEMYAHFPALGVYDSPEAYSTTEYFDNEDDAIGRLRFLQWYFARPKDQDDIYVSSRDSGFFEADAARGAVWQSVTDGTFYYSLFDADGMSTFGHFAGIDQAQDALLQAVQDSASA